MPRWHLPASLQDVLAATAAAEGTCLWYSNEEGGMWAFYTERFMKFATLDHAATSTLLCRTASPIAWPQRQISCCCPLSVTGYDVTWQQWRGNLRTCSAALLPFPYLLHICVWCLMQCLPVLEVTTSDSVVTQGPYANVPGHSCCKGYNLQARAIIYRQSGLRLNSGKTRMLLCSGRR